MAKNTKYYDCLEQKKLFNVVRSKATRVHTEMTRIQELSLKQKQIFNCSPEVSKTIENMFTNPEDLGGVDLDDVYPSKIANPIQVYLEKSAKKRKKNLRKMMTLIYDTSSEKYKASSSNQTQSRIQKEIEQEIPDVKEQIYKDSYDWSSLLTKGNSLSTSITSRRVSDLTNKKSAHSHKRTGSLPCPSLQLPALKKMSLIGNKEAEKNYLYKNSILSEIEHNKSIKQLMGNNYFQMMLRNRYEQEFKKPSYCYSIAEDIKSPSNFLKKLKRLHPEIRNRQKLILSGRNKQQKRYKPSCSNFKTIQSFS